MRQRASWPGFLEAQISSAAHLCCNILREPLDLVSVGEGEDSTGCISCCLPEKDAMLGNHDFEGQYHPHATEEAQRASAALMPQVSVRWGRTRTQIQANLARGLAFFNSACHLTMTAGSPPVVTSESPSTTTITVLPPLTSTSQVTTTCRDHLVTTTPYYCQVTILHYHLLVTTALLSH